MYFVEWNVAKIHRVSPKPLLRGPRVPRENVTPLEGPGPRGGDILPSRYTGQPLKNVTPSVQGGRWSPSGGRGGVTFSPGTRGIRPNRYNMGSSHNPPPPKVAFLGFFAENLKDPGQNRS